MWRDRSDAPRVTAEQGVAMVGAGFPPVVVAGWLRGGRREQRRWRSLLRMARGVR